MKKKEDRQLLSLITKFQGQIKQYARSHTELKRLLSNNEGPKKEKTMSAEKDKQACLYQAAKELISASVDTLFCSYILSSSTKK